MVFDPLSLNDSESAGRRFDKPIFPGPRYHHPATPELLSAKIIVRRFDRRKVFVPEGLRDSSQARSAWVAMQRDSRPRGTVEVIVSPTDICRRH
jgi:hypothetical protein